MIKLIGCNAYYCLYTDDYFNSSIATLWTDRKKADIYSYRSDNTPAFRFADFAGLLSRLCPSSLFSSLSSIMNCREYILVWNIYRRYGDRSASNIAGYPRWDSLLLLFSDSDLMAMYCLWRFLSEYFRPLFSLVFLRFAKDLRLWMSSWGREG